MTARSVFDTVVRAALPWHKSMRHKAFFVSLAVLLGMSATTSSYAQDSPFGGQKPKFKFLVDPGEEERSEEEDVREKDTLVPALETLKAAFLAGDAGILDALLEKNRRKIYLSLDVADEEQAHYGAAQIHFLFDRLFDEVLTRSFRYTPDDIDRHGDTVDFAADWTYVGVSSDETVRVRLHFLLERNQGGWHILEISDR